MRIGSCEFPDDALFEPEGLLWARPSNSGDLTLGASSILVGVTGKIEVLRPKPIGNTYEAGRVLATVESPKHFAALRAPLAGVLAEVNAEAVRSPRTISDDPYGRGWVARLRPLVPVESSGLRQAAEAASSLEAQVRALRVRCFAAVPDYEMFEIGLECFAVLAHLNDLLRRASFGEIVHLVSDDVTAPIEMVRWSMQTGHAVVESRREDNLYHFLVRKAA